MTERHFLLEQGYLVRIRSYGDVREWAVYQDGLPYGPWFGTGTTRGSVRDAKRVAHAALDRTLSAAENPISTSQFAMLGVVAVAVAAAVYFATRPTTSTTPITTTAPTGPVEQPIGSHVTPGT